MAPQIFLTSVRALAKSFRKVEREEITGAVPAGGSVCSSGCDSFVAIECSR